MEHVTGGAFDDMKEFYGWIDECYSCLNGSRGKVVGHSVDFLGYQGYVLAFCKQADIRAVSTENVILQFVQKVV